MRPMIASPTMLALYALFDSVSGRLKGVPEESFIAALHDWEIFPILEGNEPIGAVVRKKHEIHIGVTRTPPGSKRRLVHQVLLDTITRYGYAITTVADDNPRGMRFCRRLGFTIERRVDGGTYMRCEKAAHA